MHRRAQVRRAAQRGEQLGLVGVGEFVQVFEQRGQPGRDGHEPDSMALVVGGLR
ncbi:MAG: hypothetical protein RIE32_07205 [Phycisphaerales bacterium]